MCCSGVSTVTEVAQQHQKWKVFLPFGRLCFFVCLFACEPMDASASAVPHSVKRWQLSGTDYDPETVRSLQSRFSAWTPLSDKRRNVRVSNAPEILSFILDLNETSFSVRDAA